MPRYQLGEFPDKPTTYKVRAICPRCQKTGLCRSFFPQEYHDQMHGGRELQRICTTCANVEESAREREEHIKRFGLSASLNPVRKAPEPPTRGLFD